MLQKSGTPFETVEAFVMPYTQPQPQPSTSAERAREETIDLENPAPSKTAALPCPLAIEFLADICLEKAAGATGASRTAATKKAGEVRRFRRFFFDFSEMHPDRSAHCGFIPCPFLH